MDQNQITTRLTSEITNNLTAHGLYIGAKRTRALMVVCAALGGCAMTLAACSPFLAL